MKRVPLVVLALAVIVIMPAGAQTGVPVKNALVVVSPQENAALRLILGDGGPPSGVQNALQAAEELLSASAHSTSTDASGQFALDAPMSPGAYDVMVFVPGFVAASESLAVDAGAKNLTIFMQPSAMLSGRVVDSQGRPVSGAVVAASSPYSANYDVTMDDGVFVLDTGLKTGVHKIHVFKPGLDIATLQDLLNSTELGGKVPAAFKTGSSGYVSQVLEVQLEQGKLTILNVQLQDSHVVSGRVADGAGEPVQGVAVFAFNASGAMVDTAAVTDSDGRYILDNDLSPGRYTIAVPALFSKGYTPASAAVTVPAESAVDFELAKSGAITGRVTNAAGTPVAGATVSAIMDAGANGTQLSQFFAAGAAPVKTGNDGTFVLDKSIGDGAYIIVASFGSMPITASAEARTGSQTDITLDFRETITIRGKVTDAAGAGIDNASVIPSFASAMPGAELLAVKTGSSGEYELVVPLKDTSTAPLFDQVAITAQGYRGATALGNSTTELEAMPTVKISGAVIAQKPLSPPVETILMRNGTVLFEHVGAQYGVGLQTNARVLAAEFDPPGRSISLDLEGVHDAKGRSEFSIPKEFMSGPFVVALDGRLAEPASATENQTHSIIAVEHDHDLKRITIQGATAVPEFPLPAAIGAAGLAAVLAWKRLKP